MRTAEEMMTLIKNFAKTDNRIRLLALNGSRTNLAAPHDPFQDYDAAFFVEDFSSFVKDKSWLNPFGDILISQEPESGELFPPSLPHQYTFLCQFEDGVRIDFRFIEPPFWEAYFREDSLTEVLLDKDGVAPPLSPANDTTWQVAPPTERMYKDCVTEFWWVSTYVAKGLWRGELYYAYRHLSDQLHEMTRQMFVWDAGIRHGFPLSPGKMMKYLPDKLLQDEYETFCDTFAAMDIDTCWDSLFALCSLFRRISHRVGDALKFSYSKPREFRVTSYLKYVRSLKGDEQDLSPSYELSFRLMREADLPALREIFFRAIHIGGAVHYSKAERKAWAPRENDKLSDKLIRTHRCYVALSGNLPIGFGTVTEEGYLDLLYVSPEFHGFGVAGKLCEYLESYALSQGIDVVTVDASLSAKDFFLGRGYLVVKEQEIPLSGEVLINVKMKRELAAEHEQ